MWVVANLTTMQTFPPRSLMHYIKMFITSLLCHWSYQCRCSWLSHLICVLSCAATQLFKLAHKYRPETKQEKKKRLLARAEQKAAGKGDAPTKRPPVLRAGKRRIKSCLDERSVNMVWCIQFCILTILLTRQNHILLCNTEAKSLWPNAMMFEFLHLNTLCRSKHTSFLTLSIGPVNNFSSKLLFLPIHNLLDFSLL